MTVEQSRKRVLVVDDNPALLDLLSEHLQGSCYEVLTASDGSDAIRELEREAVDVVLSDIQMPAVNGLDLLRYVKEHHPQIEFILMTGYASIETAVTAVNLGARSYIRKPFKLTEVDDAIAVAIGFRDRAQHRGEILAELRRRIEKLRKAHVDLQGQQERLVRAERIRVFAETLGGFNHEMNNLAMSITSAVGCARRALSEGRGEDVARDLGVVERQALFIAELLEKADAFDDVPSTDYVAGIRMLDLRGEGTSHDTGEDVSHR